MLSGVSGHLLLLILLQDYAQPPAAAATGTGVGSLLCRKPGWVSGCVATQPQVGRRLLEETHARKDTKHAETAVGRAVAGMMSPPVTTSLARVAA